MPVWKANPDLMARLVRAQNHPANIGADVVSFAGFMNTRDELLRHVECCEASVYRHEGIAAVAAALKPARRSRKAA